MPNSNDQNVMNYETFQKLYNNGYAARQKIDDRRSEALEQNDNELADALLLEWEKLGERLREIRLSEVAQLTTHAPIGVSALSRLRKIVKQTDDELKRLENLAKALAAGARVLDILTRMILLGN